jgi:RNase P subunit RPR2
MREVLIICKHCGNQERIKIYSREEVEREKGQPVPIQCRKCGSTEIEIHG